MNDYERAAARYRAIADSIEGRRAALERQIDELVDEFMAAQDNLRQYETAPGIPLPQYRKQATA